MSVFLILIAVAVVLIAITLIGLIISIFGGVAGALVTVGDVLLKVFIIGAVVYGAVLLIMKITGRSPR